MFSKEERLNYAYAFVKYNNEDLRLDFWQDEFIKSADRFISILKSRRTGFSYATALKGLIKAMDPDRIDYTKQFVSYNESDALEKIRYVQAFYESIPDQNKKKCIVYNKCCMEFQDVNSKTTSRLISLPCRAPRGKGGDISLDEFGIFLPRISKEVYQAALYCIARGGCIEVGSTPLGKVGRFYEICTDKQLYPDYRRFYVPWWYSGALCTDVKTAVKVAESMSTTERVETFGTEILKSIFRNSDIEDFQQECECLFIDSSESYIPLELIYQNTPGMAEYTDTTDNEDITDVEYAMSMYGKEIEVFHNVDDLILNYNPDKFGKPLYFGYDVAKKKDAISIIGISKEKNKKRMVFRLNAHNLDYEVQLGICEKILNNLPVQKFMIDQTGVGEVLHEFLHKKYGDKVQGIIFTLESKENLAMSTKFSLEKKEFMLENNRDFHKDIHAIKRLPASQGRHFKYDADRENGSHADDFWSLSLANIGIINEKTSINFYNQWNESKNKNINSPTQSKIQRIPRGKSLNSILRGIK